MIIKDNRFYPLLTISVIFLIVSFVLLSILGYNFYMQQRAGKATSTAVVAKKTLTPVQEKTRDTLQQMYAATVSSLPADSTLDSAFTNTDSTKVSAFNNSLGDVNKLKTEISSLLKDSTSSTADLELARYKINELQLRVNELKSRNSDVEKENQRLRALLEKMAFTNTAASTVDNNVSSERPPAIENIKSTSPVFNASEIKIAAVNADDEEVMNTEEAEKFSGSLVVRNSLVQGMGEVMLVLIQPDGKVLRNAWESGSFETENGKKIYSSKIKFDYNKGEARRINFSVPLDSIQKGTYTLQVYNNGKVIGRMLKVIS